MSLQEEYVKAVNSYATKVQESGDVKLDFVYPFNGKTWVLTLPPSAISQKRLIGLMKDFISDESATSEEAYIKAIIPYCKVGGVQVDLNAISFQELEVLRTAYTDGLLLPLFQGGAKATETYMEAAIKSLS